MKTYFVPVEGKEYPLIQTADWRFFVPLRPIYERLGMGWGTQYNKLFKRGHILELADHPVQQRDGTFVTMTCVPLIRFGWWMNGLPILHAGQSKDFRDSISVIADHFLHAFDFALSGIISGNDPNSPAVPRGKDLEIAELQAKLAEKTAGKQRNRLPRKPIHPDEVEEWRALQFKGWNYQDIAAKAGRSPATVRRALVGEG